MVDQKIIDFIQEKNIITRGLYDVVKLKLGERFRKAIGELRDIGSRASTGDI